MTNLEKVTALTTQPQRSFHDFDFEAPNIHHSSRDGNGKSALSVTNTPKHGKRVTLSPEVHGNMGRPEKVQIAFSQDGIVIGKTLPNNKTCFTLKEDGRRSVIYSAPLVDTITSRFQLDFSSRTSMSFYSVEYIDVDGEHAAFIALRKEDGTDDSEPLVDSTTENSDQ